MSYKNLVIWKMAKELSVDIHTMSLTLPKFEQFEEAQQIRRSSKTVRSTIVEGYGSQSNDEATDHLETLYETGSLSDQDIFNDLHKRLEILGRKLNSFLQSIQTSHLKPGDQLHEPKSKYDSSNKQALPASSI